MKTTILPTTTTKNQTERKFKCDLRIADQPPSRRGFVLMGLILACFTLSPQARAVCQEGCDLANGNTFFGDDALINNTTGAGNTAIGSDALLSNTIGIRNTAIGINALASNTTGINNTATGLSALISNTTGSANTATGPEALFSNTEGFDNTAIGPNALWSNTTGNDNTATGLNALFSNTTGFENTATGVGALSANTTGSDNTATGLNALLSNTEGVENTATGQGALNDNTEGSDNTATGLHALFRNTTGSSNTATGVNALLSNTIGELNTATGQAALRNNTTGSSNTATGFSALRVNTTGFNNAAIGRRALDNNLTGSSNVALGFFAGTNLTTGDNNIDIGNRGVAAESNTIRIGTEGTQTNAYIAGIYSTPVAKGLVVKVDSTGHLGTVGSSGRFKEQIKPMGNASDAILALKPVTFRYKKEIDPERTPEFGLVAEEVEKVDPDLVVRDADGKVYTVRYDAVNAMLLNEFLKEHKKVEEQQATIEELKLTVAEQRKDFEAISMQQHAEIQALMASLKEQASQIQKVSAHIEMGKFATGRIRRSGHAPQMVVTNP